jgi:hypothetical protein
MSKIYSWSGYFFRPYAEDIKYYELILIPTGISRDDLSLWNGSTQSVLARTSLSDRSSENTEGIRGSASTYTPDQQPYSCLFSTRISAIRYGALIMNKTMEYRNNDHK